MTILLLLLAAMPLDDLYRSGDYERVAATAESVLSLPGWTRSDSLRILELEAFSLIATGREGEAESVFDRLLAMSPEHTLDPSQVSPKIRAVFDHAKRRAEARPIQPPPARVETVRVRKPVPLSVLVPGVSQLSARRPGPGYALLGAFAACVAGGVASHFSYNEAHREYLAATGAQNIADRYQTANSWYRARLAFSGAAVGVWLASLIDGIR